jgi:hypothetical protein
VKRAVINVMGALELQQTVTHVQILGLTLQVAPVQKAISIMKLLSAFRVSYSVYRANTSQIFVMFVPLLVLMYQPVFAHKV